MRDEVHRRDRAAAAARRGGAGRRRGARAVSRSAGLARCAACSALAAFLAVNPYALLDFAAFRDGLSHQSRRADDALGKLGLTEDNGLAYYLVDVHVGARLGARAVAAAGRRRLLLGRATTGGAAVLVPAPLLFLLFMGTQERYFGRWLMPVFPIVCLLAAATVVRGRRLLARRVAGAAPRR